MERPAWKPPLPPGPRKASSSAAWWLPALVLGGLALGGTPALADPAPAGPPASPAPAALPDPVVEACTSSLKSQVDCWNRGDLSGFMAGYLDSPEMTYTASGEIVRGAAALRERYQQKYGASPADLGALQFRDLEVLPLGPDHALVLGRWFLGPRGGEPVHDGVFSLVMVRREEGWRILHDHSSGRPARTARPQG